MDLERPQDARDVPPTVAEQLRQRSVALEAVLHYLSAGCTPTVAGTMSIAQDARHVAHVQKSASPAAPAAATPAPAPSSLVTVGWTSETTSETTKRTPLPLVSLAPPARATVVMGVVPPVDAEAVASEAQRRFDDVTAVGSSSTTDLQTVRMHQPGSTFRSLARH